MLNVNGLEVQINGKKILKEISFSIEEKESVALLGPSGSGKSITMRTLLGLIRPSKGSVQFQNNELTSLSEKEWTSVRGLKIGAIFQDPRTSLNPLMTIGKQICEVFTSRKMTSSKEAKIKTLELLRRMKIDSPERRFGQYPYQLSGGQCQRVLIAISVAMNPALLIADEPTTALDSVTQELILQDLMTLHNELGMSMLLITHDETIAKRLCKRVLRIKDGEIISSSNRTKKLSLSKRHQSQIERPTLLEVDSLSKTYQGISVLKQVSFKVKKGEIYGLLGESGSGKSTLAKILIQLEKPNEGRILFNGKSYSLQDPHCVQMIFQNPFSSLNPRMTIRQILKEPFSLARVKVTDRILTELLDRVGLESALLDRLSSQLSGGQCQRVAIARAIALPPQLLICDEPVSALDQDYREGILKLLVDLNTHKGVTLLLITHSLQDARMTCDRIGVFRHGELVEETSSQELFENPKHPYTRSLIQS